jgi:streptogramin lyase
MLIPGVPQAAGTWIQTWARRVTGLRIRVWVAASAVGLTACANAPSDSSGDVLEIQLSTLPPIYGEVGPEHPGFGRIADLEIGEDSTVFVLDEMNQTIHVFDDRGTHLRTFGGRGSGPGELARPVALAWGPDAQLWVVDPGNARYTVFDTNGSLVATYGHTGSTPVFHLLAVGFSAAGHLYFVTAGPDLIRQEFWLVECEVVDGTVNELQRFELTFVEQPSGFVHQGDGAVMVLPIPFSSMPVFRIGADGMLWYAATREPWVHRRSLPDGFEQTFGRAFDAPRVTPAELQEVLRSEDVDRLLSTAGPRAVAEFIGLIPDTRPHLEGFFFDDEENVWIMRSERAADGTRPIEVYEQSGTLVASARAALEAEPRPRVRDGLLAGVVRDELEVESIALYRVQR